MTTVPPFPAPRVTLDPSVTDFYQFTKQSFTMEGYRCHELDEKIPVAI